MVGLVALTWSQGAAVDRRCNPGRRVHTDRDDAEDADLLVDVRDDEMSMSGLMVTSQMATYGADFGIT